MVNSRELAEQAFSLLQDALKDSEARAAELDAELKRKRAPKNKLEQQTEVLEHRLESAEAEREQWQRRAQQFEELLENERIRIRELKKRLDVAESGPDKVGKKEVNYWRARADKFDAETRQYKKRIADLRKSLKERPAPQDQPMADPKQLAEAANLVDAQQLADVEAKLADAEAQLVDARAELSDAKPRLADAQSKLADVDALLKNRDENMAALNEEASGLKAELAGLRARQQAAAHSADEEVTQLKAEIAELSTRVEDLRFENNQLNSELVDKKTESTETFAQLNARLAEAAKKDKLIAERDRRVVELTDAQRQAEEEKRAIRDQIAGLEEELKEEKECTVNLSEIANERREQITELSEKLDEALERYEEAKWHLERASRFERLLAKRRKLIDQLIAGHRAKQKSNTALKAGLDGLRKFKAKSEQQQQKMLLRIEELSSDLKEAEERLANRQGAKDTNDKLRRAEEAVSTLEERLKAQVELIDNLESELSAAKAARQTAENQNKEISELKALVQQRNETIVKLEASIDEQPMQLGKLRGSESETTRLKAGQFRDQTLIDELQMEVDTLKAELAEQQHVADGGAQGAAVASATEIRRRDAQISDLKRTVKDQEKEIAKLSEAVAGWQKKYEFLSTEAPSAYQSLAAEK